MAPTRMKTEASVCGCTYSDTPKFVFTLMKPFDLAADGRPFNIKAASNLGSIDVESQAHTARMILTTPKCEQPHSPHGQIV